MDRSIGECWRFFKIPTLLMIYKWNVFRCKQWANQLSNLLYHTCIQSNKPRSPPGLAILRKQGREISDSSLSLSLSLSLFWNEIIFWCSIRCRIYSKRQFTDDWQLERIKKINEHFKVISDCSNNNLNAWMPLKMPINLTS